MAYRIESLLSARLFLAPQQAANRLFFVSDLSGRLSLYSMPVGGGMPQALLPPHIALQNPDLIGGGAFQVFPALGKILVMIDHDGDENYQPQLIPWEGGFPEPVFETIATQRRVHLGHVNVPENTVYFLAERRDSPLQETWRANLVTGATEKLAESEWGFWPAAADPGNRRALLVENYTSGDALLVLSSGGHLRALLGKPLADRVAGEAVALTGLGPVAFSPSGEAALVLTALLDDRYGLGLVPFAEPGVLHRVAITGLAHEGEGEFVDVRPTTGNRYLLSYNIDGCSWVYEATFDETRLAMDCRHVLVGRGVLSQGKLDTLDWDPATDRFTLSFAAATVPSQLYTVEGTNRDQLVCHTEQRLLGIPPGLLSAGEDASFRSHDGLRVSARLYLPADALGFVGARPLVYYLHGGPQSQERPDFAWFSMPLIQYLTLRGFAVFVPNARGSTGYGLAYTKHVDKDWGGQDRLDHVHAMTQVLPGDPRIDVSRAGVVGRSYGGYMTLTLAGRHPELWKASCDMFGPYDLLTFIDRLPSTWKPYFKVAVGDADKPEDRALLVERSPKTWLHQLSAPLLVIQGRNDPRVVAAESEDLARELTAQGKDVELLIFENEGHDVLKYENKVQCYETITKFFADTLKP